MKVRPREQNPEDRLAYVLQVKKDLDIDNFLRHSNRQMAYGSTLIRQTPVFVHEPRRFPMRADPAYVPYEDFQGDKMEDANKDKPDETPLHKEFLELLDKLNSTIESEEGGEIK